MQKKSGQNGPLTGYYRGALKACQCRFFVWMRHLTLSAVGGAFNAPPKEKLLLQPLNQMILT